jgi:Mg2+ and Co2+ transporter CorA
LEELYVTVSEIENTFKSQAETRSNYLIGILTVYGFPWALIASFFGFIFEGKIDWRGVFFYIVLSFAVVLILFAVDKRSGKLSR